MPEVKQEAGAVGVKAAGRWAVPGDDIGDWQARHPVVGQSQVAVLLAAPDREEEGGEEKWWWKITLHSCFLTVNLIWEEWKSTKMKYYVAPACHYWQKSICWVWSVPLWCLEGSVTLYSLFQMCEIQQSIRFTGRWKKGWTSFQQTSMEGLDDYLKGFYWLKNVFKLSARAFLTHF